MHYSNIKYWISIVICILLVTSCEKGKEIENMLNHEQADSSSIYSIDKEQLGEWSEGYIYYNAEDEKQSYYAVSKYDDDECIRIIYIGQLCKEIEEGYYIYCDSLNNVLALKGNNCTFVYNGYMDLKVWSVYTQDSILMNMIEIGPVSLNGGSTRTSTIGAIMDLRSLFINLNLGWHQEWGDLTANIGTSLILKALKIGYWPVQIGVELMSNQIKSATIKILYDGCIPEISNCEKDGKIKVTINGITNLTDKFVYPKYNPDTELFEPNEEPGKEVYMAVAIRKDNSYVTYSKCDNHTTYVKLSPNQSIIDVLSNVEFKPGISYYLRPYLIEKSLFKMGFNTYRQWFIQYGKIYKFRYTTVTIDDFTQEFGKAFSETQYAIRASVLAKINSLNEVENWGVAVYDKNNELLKKLECNARNGKLENKFLFEGYLSKSLFIDWKTDLIVVPFAKYKDGRYAYGDRKKYEISSEIICPDSNHPHEIDLGLPSGTKWACCNVGAKAPEEFGDYYAWGETQTKNYYGLSNYPFAVPDENGILQEEETGPHYRYIETILDIAGTNYDAATVNWGIPWQMPTFKQFKELKGNTSYEWTTLNGVGGIMFTSPKGSIFLPAAGMRFHDEPAWGVGIFGDYWTSSLDDGDKGYDRYARSSCVIMQESQVINDPDIVQIYYYARGLSCYGQSIRPVSKN